MFFFRSHLERVEPTDERPGKVYCARVFVQKNTLADFILSHLIDVGAAAFDLDGEMYNRFKDLLGNSFCFIFKHDDVPDFFGGVSTTQGAPCAAKTCILGIVDVLQLFWHYQ